MKKKKLSVLVTLSFLHCLTVPVSAESEIWEYLPPPTLNELTFVPVPQWFAAYFRDGWVRANTLAYTESGVMYSGWLRSVMTLSCRLPEKQNDLTELLAVALAESDQIEQTVSDNGIMQCEIFNYELLDEAAAAHAEQVCNALSERAEILSFSYRTHDFEYERIYNLNREKTAPDGNPWDKYGVYDGERAEDISGWLLQNAPEWQVYPFDSGESLYLSRADRAQSWDQGEYLAVMEALYEQFDILPYLVFFDDPLVEILSDTTVLRGSTIFGDTDGDGEVNLTDANAAAVTADDIARQIRTHIPPVDDMEAYTQKCYLFPCLAFRWKSEGTPAGAVIGGHTLTENTEKLLNEYHAPYQIQSVKTMADLLPTNVEAYGNSTFDVPEEMQQSGIWVVSGASDPEIAESLLQDARIEVCGLLYTTHWKYYAWAAILDENGEMIGAEPELLQDLNDLHYSLELVPLRHYAYGDTDGDGEVNLTDANAALLYYNLAAVAMADEAYYNLTPYEAKAADVNRDGIVDTKDANAIMLYYNCTVVSQVDGITWYDILKISGVPGAPA